MGEHHWGSLWVLFQLAKGAAYWLGMTGSSLPRESLTAGSNHRADWMHFAYRIESWLLRWSQWGTKSTPAKLIPNSPTCKYSELGEKLIHASWSLHNPFFVSSSRAEQTGTKWDSNQPVYLISAISLERPVAFRHRYNLLCMISIA